MNKLDIIDLTKSFGKNLVIEHLSLVVEKGDILALTGESGCGKTTVLRMIAGLDSPDFGNIKIDGIDITSLSPSHRKVGLVFQDLALFPHMNVRQNIAFGLEKKGPRIDEFLELTALRGLQKRYPNQLSGGQKQRVALARTLAAAPEILLLDEPFSSLDSATHDKVRNEIYTLIKNVGITTVLVTHHSVDAFLMADRVAILRSGRLLQEDNPVQIYQNPKDEYTASFFGSCIVLTKSNSFGTIPKEGNKFLIRPEQVTKSRTHGTLAGRVSMKFFKGRHEVLIISSLDGGEQISLETEHSNFVIGDKIYLQLQIEKIKSLPNQ